MLRVLPLRLLLGGLGPFTSARGGPVASLGTIPRTGGSASLPLTSSRRGSDDLGNRGNGLLLDRLVLVGLLLSLGVRVTVCEFNMLAKNPWFLTLWNRMVHCKGTKERKHTEVQIRHDVPRGLAVGDSATEAEDLSSEQPPDSTNGVATLVVGRNGNIDVLGGRVSVAEGNHGNVDVGSLLDGLGIGTGISDDDQTGLLERSGDVVGEGTGGEATCDRGGTGVGSELENGTLTIGTGGDDTNVGRVVNGDDDTSSKDNLLPENKQLDTFPVC